MRVLVETGVARAGVAVAVQGGGPQRQVAATARGGLPQRCRGRKLSYNPIIAVICLQLHHIRSIEAYNANGGCLMLRF